MSNNAWHHFGLSEELLALAAEAEAAVAPYIRQISYISEANQLRVVAALQRQRLSDYHLDGSTGYGYGDIGRELLDAAYAEVFGMEAAIVRPHFVSGTHAIACALMGNLQHGDEILLASGKPYDTLEKVIGLRPSPLGNSLREAGITHRLTPLTPTGRLDLPAITAAITERTRMVHLQRSRGYALRPALSLQEIGEAVRAIKQISPEIICFVDNCYGEFVETDEPGSHGVDLIAGSLIKNPGGGLALCGGYIAGREELVARASERLTAPGLGSGMGATVGHLRPMLQGLFLAPNAVGEALKGAIFAAGLFRALGFAVDPQPEAVRYDIIQSISFHRPEQLIAFCQGIQAAAPVDAHVVPEPGQLPGYTDPVIMAAGTFVQGASLELSADAPIREPYTAFFQGGLTYAHAKLGIMIAARRVLALR